MDNSIYNEYIDKTIYTIFEKIYVIDIMSDLVYDYRLNNGKFTCKDTIPFTTFFTTLETIIHPDDLKGYIDSLNNNTSTDIIRYEYRKRKDGAYLWYTNIVKLLDINNKKISLVFVENANENIIKEETSKITIEKVQDKQKIIFNSISNSIAKLNNIINISCDSNNPEVKSITEYINDILMDLTNSFPEISKKLSEDMITNTNQGKEKTILIVDDDQMTCNLLTKTFENMYKIISLKNGKKAIDYLEENNDIKSFNEKDKIVGMFLDLNMPEIDGFGVLDYMNTKNLLNKIPVIIISGDYDEETKNRIYTYPIADMLEKPFNMQVVKHRISNLIKLYKTNNSLNDIVLNQHQDIKNVLKTLVKSYLCDYANDINRITKYMNILARQVDNDYTEYNIGNINFDKMIDAAKYYNIGFSVLPRNILNKQDYTTEEERIIRCHPLIGITIFDSVLYRNTDRVFNHYAKEMIEFHHENYDGSGYPHGIKENEIPLCAQILAVAVEYNDLVKVMNENSVLGEIEKKSGSRFNPKIVDSLKKCIDDIKE